MNSLPSPSERLAARLPGLLAAWRERRAAPPRGSGSSASRPLSPDELSRLAASLLQLQRGLTGGRELAGSSYMDDESLLGAYLLYYWPVSYMQIALILEELRPKLAEGPKRILDFGCGPGAMAAALIDAGANDIELVDHSRAALELAGSLLRPERAIPGSSSTLLSYISGDLESEIELPDDGYDFIVFGHSLNELWKTAPDRDERRHALLERASRLLNPRGILLVIEPAVLVTSRETLGLRDRLAADGHEIVGPCPGSYACPILAAGVTRTCHLDTPWDPPEPVASLARLAGLDRQSVKCTWFALRPSGRNSAATIPSALKPGSIDGARVVSDPMLNKAGRIRYVLCGDGKLSTISAAKDDLHAASLGFFDLRRGDIVKLADAELRASGLGLTERTQLEILRRAPLPGASKKVGP